MVTDFEFLFCFFFNAHGVVPYLIDLCYDLSAHTQQISGLFFISNMEVKRHSAFLALGFLTGVGFMGDLGLFSENL